MTIRFNTRQAVHKLVRSGMPEAQADATVEVAEDSTRGLVTEEQLEATLNRALLRQAAIIITIDHDRDHRGVHQIALTAPE